MLQPALRRFPGLRGLLDLVGHGAELAIQMLGAAGDGIRLRTFELTGELGLLGFEGGHRLFEFANLRPQFADLTGAEFERRCGRGFRSDRRRLRGSLLQGAGIGEARGEPGALVDGLRFVEVVLVVAGVVREPAGVDVEDQRRQRADEIDVMADEYQRAFVLLEGVDERIDRGDVEVGRRLIHEQEIRRIDEQASEREAGFLPAGEYGDALEDVVLAEEEGGQDGAGLLLGELVGLGAQLHHVFEYRGVELEVVAAILGEIAGDDIAAELAFAALNGNHAAENLEQGGLARAVGADEHDALAALDLQVEVAVDDVVAISLLHVLERHDLEPGARGLREAEIHALELLHRLLDGVVLEPLDLLLLRLGAGGHGGLGAEAVDELLQMRDLALLVFEDGGLLRFARLLLRQEIVVVARVAMQGAAAQLEHAVAQGVEEGAIMRDHQQAAGIAHEVLLEPEQSLEIEMVGRLVEQQQRRLAHEEAGEMRAHHPAAGKRIRSLVMVALAETEAGENLFGAGLERPIDVVVLVIGRHELLAAGGEVQDGLVAGRRALLRQEAEIGAALPTDRAIVWRLLAEDEIEKRGFACAVGAHEAEAVGARDKKRDLGEEFAGTVGLGDVGDREHGSGQTNGNGPGGVKAGRKWRVKRKGQVPRTQVTGGSRKGEDATPANLRPFATQMSTHRSNGRRLKRGNDCGSPNGSLVAFRSRLTPRLPRRTARPHRPPPALSPYR